VVSGFIAYLILFFFPPWKAFRAHRSERWSLIFPSRGAADGTRSRTSSELGACTSTFSPSPSPSLPRGLDLVAIARASNSFSCLPSPFFLAIGSSERQRRAPFPPFPPLLSPPSVRRKTRRSSYSDSGGPSVPFLSFSPPEEGETCLSSPTPRLRLPSPLFFFFPFFLVNDHEIEGATIERLSFPLHRIEIAIARIPPDMFFLFSSPTWQVRLQETGWSH